MKRLTHFCLLLFFLWSFQNLFALNGDTTRTAPPAPARIQLNTLVESSRVPLNRPVIFHIELSWPGELSRYQIEPVSQPILTNLLLEGSGSENRLEPQEDGTFKAIKSITYHFKPLEMGMAYIDGVVVKYVDRETGEENQLSSQRIMVEIVEPLPEEGEGPVRAVIYIVLLLIFFAVLLYFIILYWKKRKQAQHSLAPVESLPEIYLNRLAQEVDPRGTNLAEMTARLSKIFREYLDEDFGIRARESSTQEIVAQLTELNLEERDRENLKTVLEKLDLIKFAGKNVDPADFTDIFGTIEAFLIKRKQLLEEKEVELKEE